MAYVKRTPALTAEYERLFETCSIRSGKQTEVEAILGRIAAARGKYDKVAGSTGVPWSFVAVVHSMESSLRFDRHLHNGDSLRKRTVHVPTGRPPTGDPPFAWEVSAADALGLKKLDQVKDWSVAGTLYQLERYNGWGYRLHHPHVRSPYLWSGSQHYTSGKYVSDGTWSDSAKSKQIGAAVLLRRMAEKGAVSFSDQARPADGGPPLVAAYATTRSRSAALVAKVEALQAWLNTFPGLFVKVDGIPGPKTSEAYKAVTGSFLPDDPRASK